MKKIVAVVLCVLITSLTYSQKRKHEISAGFGVGTTNQILNTFSDVLTSGLTVGLSSSNSKYSGAFQLGYKYAATSRLFIGPVFIYEQCKSDAYLNQEKRGTFDKKYYTIAAEVEYRYIAAPNFAVYSLAGVGGSRIDQKYESDSGGTSRNNKTYFNFQLTPVGLKIGSRFGGFGELGFGYKGIFSVGVFGNF